MDFMISSPLQTSNNAPPLSSFLLELASCEVIALMAFGDRLSVGGQGGLPSEGAGKLFSLKEDNSWLLFQMGAF